MAQTRIDLPTENGRQFPIKYFSGYPDEVYFGQSKMLIVQQKNYYNETFFYTFFGMPASLDDSFIFRIRPKAGYLSPKALIEDLPF